MSALYSHLKILYLSLIFAASRKKRVENGRLLHHGSSPEIKRKSVLSSAVSGGDDDFGKWNHNQTDRGNSRTSGESTTWENEKVTSQHSSSRSNPKHKSHLNASTRSLSSSTVGNQKSTQQKTHGRIYVIAFFLS